MDFAKKDPILPHSCNLLYVILGDLQALLSTNFFVLCLAKNRYNTFKEIETCGSALTNSHLKKNANLFSNKNILRCKISGFCLLSFPQNEIT